MSTLLSVAESTRHDPELGMSWRNRHTRFNPFFPHRGCLLVLGGRNIHPPTGVSDRFVNEASGMIPYHGL